MTDIWQTYQIQYSGGTWLTYVMCNEHRVKSFTTVTAWGGRRKAKKLIRRRRND